MSLKDALTQAALKAQADRIAAEAPPGTSPAALSRPALGRQFTVADVAAAAKAESIRKKNSPPRAAKSSASLVVQAKTMDELREEHLKANDGPLRYKVRTDMPLSQKVWMTLDDPGFVNPHPGCSWPRLATHYAYFSIFLISLSCTAYLLATDINCELKLDAAFSGRVSLGHDFVTAENCASWEDLWMRIELVAVIVFTAELLARFATCPDRRRFVRMGFNWVDLMAVLPYYIEVAVLAMVREPPSSAMQAMSVLRVFRLARIFKLLKMGNASQSMQLVSATAGAAMLDSLTLLAALLMVTAIAMVVFAAALSTLEPGSRAADPARPETYGDADTWFLSITRTAWWALVTLTGVGYGDEWPSGLAGRVIAIVCACVGIIIIAVPIEVIGRYFGAHFTRHEYARSVRAEICAAGGRVDVRALYERLRLLARQGLLKVRCPSDAKQVARLVAAYDAKGAGELEQDEWAGLLEDVVAHRGDWEGCALRRTVDYLAAARGELRQAAAELDALQRRRQHQHADLCRIVRERYPNGIPRGGVKPPRRS